MEAIRAWNITKDYKQGFNKQPIRAVNDLSISIEQGEVFGFLGPNGAGKTTLIKILLNIIFPTSGHAEILGIDIRKPMARKYVGYLPENPYFFDRMNAYQLLDYYGAFYDMSGEQLRKRREEVLSITGLTDAAHRKLRGYSKGMLQRVGLAQAILPEPKVVFLDEPSTGLDPMGRKKIKDVIKNLKEQGTTVFLNSHILADVEDTCDRIAIVKNGHVIKIGNVRDLMVNSHGLRIKMSNITDEIVTEMGNITSSCKKLSDDMIEIVIESSEQTPDIVNRIVELGGRIFEVRFIETSLEDTFIDTIMTGGVN